MARKGYGRMRLAQVAEGIDKMAMKPNIMAIWKDDPMPNYSVATTKDNLSSLIDKAQAGEEVIITRRGKPAARLVPIEAAPRKDVAAATARLLERLRALPPIKADIPPGRFRDWLYSDYDY